MFSSIKTLVFVALAISVPAQAALNVGASYFGTVTSITPQANNSGVRIMGTNLVGAPLIVVLYNNTPALATCFALANTAFNSPNASLEIIGNGLNYGSSNEYDTSNPKFFCNLYKKTLATPPLGL